MTVPGCHRHRFPSKGKGREVNTTCNRRSLHPPDATRIWRSNCAQKRKGLGPSNHQTPTWETESTNQAPANPNAFQNRCGECINSRGATIPHQSANQQALKKRKGEFAISSGSPPPTSPGPQAFLVLCLVVPGCQRHRFPPKGKGREVNTTCNRSSLHNPPMQSAFGGAIAHKSAKALDRQTTKPTSTHLGNQSKRAETSTTKCISKPVW